MSAADDTRRLYVYYRVPAGALGPAQAAVQALQVRLRQQQPGLQAELLQRPLLPGDDTCTLMEIYRLPGAGIDAASQDRIEAQAAQALAGWLIGPRQVEVFCAL